MLYHRLAHAPRPVRLWFGLALGAILVLTLTPAGESERPLSVWCVACGDGGRADFVLNVLLFAPLGTAFWLIGVEWLPAFGFGAALSIAIELAQMSIPGRDTSLGDVISNSGGTLLGFAFAALVVHATRRHTRVTIRSLAAPVLMALGVGVLIGGTGWSLQPGFPSSDYWGQWTADMDGDLGWYRGHVLSASLGDLPLPSERLSHQPEVHARLAAGDSLLVKAVAGPVSKPGHIAPVFSIYDEHQREILLLGPRNDDLVFRYASRGGVHGFDQPAFTIPGMVRGIRTGDTLRIALWRAGNGYCVRLNNRSACGLAWSATMGWAAFKYSDDEPAWVYEALGIAWIGGLAFLVGCLTRFPAELLAGGVATAVIMAVVPPLVGFKSLTALGWASAAGGLIVASVLRRLLLPRVAAWAALASR